LDLESVRFEMESVLFGVESVRCDLKSVLFGLESVLIKVEMVYFLLSHYYTKVQYSLRACLCAITTREEIYHLSISPQRSRVPMSGLSLSLSLSLSLRTNFFCGCAHHARLAFRTLPIALATTFN
jgi:hypothetical protein